MTIIEADLACPAHQETVLALVNAYSCDPMGDGHPLSEDAKRSLIPGLQNHPTTHIFLAFLNETPIGIAVCFLGFSTFAAKPLMNIHDLSVLPAWRGKGFGKALLAAVEKKARELGCCKLTLEVLDMNHQAKKTYQAAGFSDGTRATPEETCLFYSKRLF
jgi:GNAT superfamily N-acetyltransferase